MKQLQITTLVRIIAIGNCLHASIGKNFKTVEKIFKKLKKKTLKNFARPSPTEYFFHVFSDPFFQVFQVPPPPKIPGTSPDDKCKYLISLR